MTPPYHNGRVHVMADLCSTCVFRGGNLMHLPPGRLADLVRANVTADAALACHSTTYGQAPQEAICRGFADRYRTTPIQLAERLDLITLVPVPPPKGTR